MIYDGVVMRDDKSKQLYLFIYDPDINMINDGISISENKCYDNMKNNQMMVVNVNFKDGTKDVQNIDLDEFIHGDKYGENNIFILIHDLSLFSASDNENNNPLTLDYLLKEGTLNQSIIDCIEITKNNISKK